MDYRISGERLKGFADQARRLGKISGELTPGQIEETLKGVTAGGGSAFQVIVTDKIQNHIVSAPKLYELIRSEATDEIKNQFVSVAEFMPGGIMEEYTPRKYYYNGELLPEIPSAFENLAYRCILKWPNGNVQLIGSANGLYFNGNTGIYDISNAKLTAYYLGGDNWTVDTNQSGKYSGWTVISDGESVLLWSSHDIPNGSATATDIYFEGSEPVPVE